MIAMLDTPPRNENGRNENDLSDTRGRARALLDAVRTHAVTQDWRDRLKTALAVVWPWRTSAAAALAGLAFMWYVAIPALLGPVVTVDPVVRADFVQTVVASGHVEAPFRVNIGSQITGVVADVPVSEGQAVKAGETLIRLDDKEARAAVVQAEGAIAQAEARMRQLKEFTLPSAEEAFRQAQATMVNAQQAYDRANKLVQDSYGTQVKLEDALKALEIAQAQSRAAELQIYTARPGGSDYVMAQSQLDQARASLAAARSKLGYATITAPRDGVLISRDVERGNVVQPSAVLMKLSPSGDTQLVVQVDEKNLGLMAVGQKALVSADAYAKETFPAEVVYINPGIDLQRASVEVKLRVPEPPAYLRQDMTVSVDIETARRPSTLIVPAASVRSAANGKPWVLTAENGRATRRRVKLGLQGVGKTEILDGVPEGALIIPATATAVTEGATVRAQAAKAAQP
jgi:HlyD family secretion protein